MDEKALAVTEQASDPVALFNEEVRFQQALAVMEHRVTHGSTTEQACQAVGVPLRTFYYWLKQGVLTDHIQELRKLRAEASASGRLPGSSASSTARPTSPTARWRSCSGA